MALEVRSGTWVLLPGLESDTGLLLEIVDNVRFLAQWMLIRDRRIGVCGARIMARVLGFAGDSYLCAAVFKIPRSRRAWLASSQGCPCLDWG